MIAAAVLKRELIVNKIACRVIGIAAFTVLTALGAFVRIPLPFSPVPVTLQTMFVLLSGAFLGLGFGVAAQALYVALGIAGMPIFSGAGSGLFYLSGPTGGYLIGFIVSAHLIARGLKNPPHTFLAVFGRFLAADLLIFIFGILWLKAIFGSSLSTLLLIGFVPFIPGDLLKTCVAAAFYFRLKDRLKVIFG
jgi:biotin transport system substrate-specific component